MVGQAKTGSLDSIWEVPFTLANHNKIAIGRRFFPMNKLKEGFTLIVPYPGTTPVQYFPKKVKRNPDGSNVIGEAEDLDVHKNPELNYVLTLWNW